MPKAPVRLLLVIVLVLAATGWASSSASGVDWSQFHFGPSQRGTNPYETTLTHASVGRLSTRWTARWYAPPDWFCDVCTGGYHQIPATAPLQVGHLTISVFTFGGVRAYDSVTGALRWSADDGEGCCDSINNIAEANGIVYWPVGPDDHQFSDGDLVALEARTGKDLWSRWLEGEPGGPVAAGGAVYAAGGGIDDPTLFALDGATGATLWRRSPCTACSSLSTPAVGHGLVVVAAGGTLRAYSAASGAPAWKRSDCAGTPALSGSALYTSDGCKLDLATGHLIWKREPPSRWTAAGSPAVASGMVFRHLDEFNCSDGCSSVVEARSARTGGLVWRRSAGPGGTSPTAAAGVVYVASDGKIRALRAATGALLWSHSLDGPVRATPSVANGRLEIGTVSGRLYAFGLP